MNKKIWLFCSVLLLANTSYGTWLDDQEKDRENILEQAEKKDWDKVITILNKYDNDKHLHRFLQDLLKEDIKNTEKLQQRSVKIPENIPFLAILAHKKTPLNILQKIISLTEQAFISEKQKNSDNYSDQKEIINSTRLWSYPFQDITILFQALKYGTPKQVDALYNNANKLGITPPITTDDSFPLSLTTESEKSDKVTPLHVATFGGNLEVIKYLEKKLNLEKEDFENDKAGSGLNPLLLAAQEGHLDTVKYLIEEKKVNLNAKNNYEQDALDLAEDSKNSELISYLEQKMGRLSKANQALTELAQALKSLP